MRRTVKTLIVLPAPIVLGAIFGVAGPAPASVPTQDIGPGEAAQIVNDSGITGPMPSSDVAACQKTNSCQYLPKNQNVPYVVSGGESNEARQTSQPQTKTEQQPPGTLVQPPAQTEQQPPQETSQPTEIASNPIG